MRRGHLAVVVTGAAAGVVLVACGGRGDDGSGRARAAPPSGAPVAPVSTTSDGLTSAQRALVATLGPLRVHDCVAAARDRVGGPPGKGATSGIDAAVMCQTNVVAGEAGPRELVARHYTSAAALGADLSARSRAVGGTGDCDHGQAGTQTWGRSDRALGSFVCAPGAANAFDIFWTVTADQAGISASSTDAAGLLAWWRDFTKP